MPNQYISGRIIQTVNDTDITEVIKIPVNSKSRFETPLIRIKYIELQLDQAAVVNWVGATSLKFVMERYPVIGRNPVRLVWSFARFVGGGTGATVIECVKEWDSINHSLPVISANQLQLSLKTTATNMKNSVDYLMYYEEIENPTELELTLALM
jgi:hypothetical protein